MKRDGRTLDHATLEEFRLLALRRVREGVSRIARVANSFCEALTAGAGNH